MVAWIPLISLLFVVKLTSATPLPQSPSVNPTGILCRLPVVGSTLCQGSSPPNYPINTSKGTALGTLDTPGAVRYAVRYGSARRWATSSVASRWDLPNGATDPTSLPTACPQYASDGETIIGTEDCLSMILYVPTTLNPQSHAPTFMWIHGGSFVVGSATDPGLDGAKLAVATNSIVAVVQYRLGSLGFTAPDGPTNLGVQDVSTALDFLQDMLQFFGGDHSKITIAGQSSGGTMVRALLAAPSVSSKFQSAIIQSDPMDYGFLSNTAQTAMQTYFNSNLTCSSNHINPSCFAALSISNILAAQNQLYYNAVSVDPSAGQGEPIRPVNDGQFITTTLDSSSPFPRQTKPLLITNVLNEAGPTIYNSFPDALPQLAWPEIVDASLGTQRGATVIESPYYQASSATADARSQLQLLGTDYDWRCATWTFARNWVQYGGNAYVGTFMVGATYPDNANTPFCTQPGSVCHEDDINIIFGNVNNPNPAQSALITEMQARYKAFMYTGNPNTNGVSSWTPATTTDMHSLQLGGNGEAPAGACVPTFWGESVQYDYQVYGS